MPLLINIESTIDEPIRFFLYYSQSVRENLHKQYTRLNEPDRYYDPQKKTVLVTVETRIDEDVTETTIEEWSFENFIKSRVEDEINLSKRFISETYRIKVDSEKTWAYKRLLRAFVNHYERLKNYPDYPEFELLPSALRMIVEYAMKQYDQMYSFPLIVKVKKIIKAEGIINTGYTIKSKYRPHINDFNDKLIKDLFIDSNTKPEQWYQFFRGEFLQEKIDWIVDKPENHLWCFIQKIEKSEILIEFPKQQWKHLPKIFTFNDEEFTSDFYKDHTYLNEKSTDKLDQAFVILKS